MDVDTPALLDVIAQERATVAYLTARLREKARKADRVRWRALKKYHLDQIKRRRAQLRAGRQHDD